MWDKNHPPPQSSNRTPNGTRNMSAIHTLSSVNRSLVVMRTVLHFWLNARSVVLSTFMIAFPAESLAVDKRELLGAACEVVVPLRTERSRSIFPAQKNTYLHNTPILYFWRVTVTLGRLEVAGKVASCGHRAVGLARKPYLSAI